MDEFDFPICVNEVEGLAIASHKHKYICLCFPKTGSTSMLSFLEKNYAGFVLWHQWSDCAIYCEYPKRKSFITHLPNTIKNYFIFSMVRNPYHHELSTYKFYYGPTGINPTFEKFSDYLMNGKLRSFAYLSEKYRNATHCPEGYHEFKLNEIIHLEKIESEICKLPFIKSDVKFPNLQKNAKSPPIYYTQKLANIVRDIRYEDFVYCEYDLKCPKELMRDCKLL